jgi:hypothetical protein
MTTRRSLDEMVRRMERGQSIPTTPRRMSPVDDPWLPLVAEWVKGKSWVLVEDILTHAALPGANHSRPQPDKNRVARILVTLKGKMTRRRGYRLHGEGCQ